MKHIYKLLLIPAIALAALLAGACSDKLELRNDIGSEVYESGSMRVSRFKLLRQDINIDQKYSEVTISLQSHSDGSVLDFNASVEHLAEHQWINVYIPAHQSIPDSDYDLSFSLPDSSRLPIMLTVTFRDEMLYQISGARRIYDLEGKGTFDDPYLIQTTTDLSNFQIGLQDDPNCGAGYYFMQMADIVAPSAGDAVNGRLYAPADFAGNYDGRNHAITMQYSGVGDEKDNNVGIFARLINDASVQNLTINASIRGGNSFVGAVAGRAEGNILLRNVTVKGYVVGGDNVGGFIGLANGSITASACYLGATISGNNKVGGFIGQLEAGSLSLDGFSNMLFSTPEEVAAGADRIKMHDFTAIAQQNHAGGVAGYLNGTVKLSNVTLRHTIDGETADIKVIYANSYAGGLIGQAVISGESSIATISSVAPVTAVSEYCGGLIGRCEQSATLTIAGLTVGTQLQGGSYVGAFFGYISTNGQLSINNSAKGEANYIGAVNNGFAAVKGSAYVGGAFGYLSGDIKCSGSTTIKVNVTASGSCCGGIIGKQYYNTLECPQFTMSNDMTVTGQDKVGGLVGYSEHCTINGRVSSEIKVTDRPKASEFTSDFTGTARSSSSSGSYIGGAVGHAYDVYLHSICVTGTIEGGSYIGGIAGCLENVSRGYCYDCVANLERITNKSADCTGGLFGALKVKTGGYSRLINYTTVDGNDLSGGIIGFLQLLDGLPAFEITYLLNNGPVNGTAQVGGCIGYIEHEITDDYRKNDVAVRYAGNFGNVTASADGNVGGIVGHGNTSRMIITNSANHGSIHSSANSKVGGIVGRIGHDAEGASFYLGENIELAYCCNRGQISSTGVYSNLGGIAGYQEEGNDYDELHWMTHDCYNAGSVTSDQDDDNGGLVGWMDHYSEIGQCLNFGNVSYGNGGVGTRPGGGIFYYNDIYILDTSGKDWRAETFSYADRANQSTFSGFDFVNVWLSNDSKNDSYPSLRNCPFQFP